MPETPIQTEAGGYPFDAAQLDTIRDLCAASLGDDPLLTISYATTVIPALIDKILQLRALLERAAIELEQARTDSAEIYNLLGEVDDAARRLNHRLARATSGRDPIVRHDPRFPEPPTTSASSPAPG